MQSETLAASKSPTTSSLGKTGVLIVNLGTPDSPSRKDVYKYLKQFLLDPRVIDINPILRNLLVRGIIAPFRSGSSAKLYKELWDKDGSPLKYYGERLVKGVQNTLGDNYVVVLGMRYQNPSIKSALTHLLDAQVSNLIVLPLFPHYASASSGSVHEEVMRLLSKEQAMLNTKLINSFHDYAPMIELFAEKGLAHNPESYDHVLFSFHGLPQRHMKKVDRTGQHCLQSKDCCQTLCLDNQHCYSAQCYDTARKISAILNLSDNDYTVCFQSRLGRDPWVQPYTTDVLEERAKAGDKRLLVYSPAFVADCLETTIEISDEYAEEWEKMGGEHLQLVESLNDDPKWIQAVADLIKSS